MKKILVLLIGLFCFNLIPVKAIEEVNLNVLHEINSNYNVTTNNFNYENINYNPTLDSTGRSTITIGNIHNNTSRKVPISIRIGLFDANKKNIGVVNYCSTHDTESDYSYKLLLASEDSKFSLKVSENKHLAKNKKISDVSYIAVLNDNIDCTTDGMANKYTDLTIEEITNGNVAAKVEKIFDFSFLNGFADVILSKEVLPIIIYIGGGLILLIILGEILNVLNKRMFNKTTILAYIPISNVYLIVKLAFGKVIGLIYLVLFLISVALIKVVPILFLVAAIILLVAFLLDIIKLLIKRYDLLYFENFHFGKKINDKIDNYDSNKENNNNIYDFNNTTKNSLLDNEKNDLLSDLGVNLDDNTATDSEDLEEKETPDEQFFNISAGGMHNNFPDEDKDEDDNGSDLTDLFK